MTPIGIDESEALSFAGSYPAGSTVVLIGDSNTNGRDPGGGIGGRPDFTTAFLRELQGENGIYEDCNVYNIACNGSQIKGWVDSIATGEADASSDPDDIGNICNVWAAKTLEPSSGAYVIHVKLGTNEQWDAGFRATVGVEATQLANFNTLIGWLLNNTRADLVLITPQPIAYAVSGIGDWANADEAAESSRIMRATYLNCQYVNHPRVRLVDTHVGMFGLRVDTQTEHPDPQSGDQWYADKLHLTAIGYRRELEYVSAAISGVKVPRVRVKSTPDHAMLTNAKWSETVYISAIQDVGSYSVISVPLDPLTIFDGIYVSVPTHYPRPLNTLQHLPATRSLAQFGAFNRLATAGAATYDRMFCWCHASGKMYSLGRLALNQVVDATPGQWYAVLTPEYQRDYGTTDAAEFTSDDVGPVTFWTEDAKYNPRLGRNESTFNATVVLGDTVTAVAGGEYVKYRFFRAATDVAINCFAMVAPSGSFGNYQVYKNGVALAPSGVLFDDGEEVAASPGLSTQSFAVGDVLQLNCISNPGNSKGIQMTLTGQQLIY